MRCRRGGATGAAAFSRGSSRRSRHQPAHPRTTRTAATTQVLSSTSLAVRPGELVLLHAQRCSRPNRGRTRAGLLGDAEWVDGRVTAGVQSPSVKDSRSSACTGTGPFVRRSRNRPRRTTVWSIAGPSCRSHRSPRQRSASDVSPSSSSSATSAIAARISSLARNSVSPGVGSVWSRTNSCTNCGWKTA